MATSIFDTDEGANLLSEIDQISRNMARDAAGLGIAINRTVSQLDKLTVGINSVSSGLPNLRKSIEGISNNITTSFTKLLKDVTAGIGGQGAVDQLIRANTIKGEFLRASQELDAQMIDLDRDILTSKRSILEAQQKQAKIISDQNALQRAKDDLNSGVNKRDVRRGLVEAGVSTTGLSMDVSSLNTRMRDNRTQSARSNATLLSEETKLVGLGNRKDNLLSEVDALTDEIDRRRRVLEEHDDALDEAFRENIYRDKEHASNIKQGNRAIIDAISQMVSSIYNGAMDIRKTLSVSFGEGASRFISRTIGEYTSAIGAVFGGGPMVLGQERAQSAVGFKNEFGGVIKSEQEVAISREAKLHNMFGDELLKGTRSVIALTGNLDAAKTLVLDAAKGFTVAGITNTEAMEFAKENSELLARAGKDGAGELFKLGVEAKRAGYNLTSIQKFGDDVATDFGGFLDKAAELSALGVNVDVAGIGKASLSGDMSDMVTALQNSFGTSIDNFTRVQQIQASKLTGVGFDELMRTVKGKEIAASAKDQADINAAKDLSITAKMGEASLFILKGLLVAVGSIATMMAIKNSLAAGMGISNVLGKILPSSISAGLKALPIGGIVAGLFGSITGFMGAKAAGKSNTSSAGMGAVQGGFAAGGAILGSMLGPLGTVVGGFIGNFIGQVVNKYLPQLGEGIGKYFEGLIDAFSVLKSTFDPLVSAVKNLVDSFKDIFKTMGVGIGDLGAFGSVLKVVGQIVGGVLLLPLKMLVMGLTSLANLIAILVKVSHGDFSGAGDIAKSMVHGAITQAKSMIGIKSNTSEHVNNQATNAADVAKLNKASASAAATKSPAAVVSINTDAIKASVDSMKEALIKYSNQAIVLQVDGREFATAQRENLRITDHMAASRQFERA